MSHTIQTTKNAGAN